MTVEVGGGWWGGVVVQHVIFFTISRTDGYGHN